jgi:hypothetical protein
LLKIGSRAERHVLTLPTFNLTEEQWTCREQQNDYESEHTLDTSTLNASPFHTSGQLAEGAKKLTGRPTNTACASAVSEFSLCWKPI